MFCSDFLLMSKLELFEYVLSALHVQTKIKISSLWPACLFS